MAVACARLTGIAPKAATQRLAGAMLAGTAKEKAEAAKDLDTLIATDPQAANDLTQPERKLVAARAALDQRGIPNATATA